MNGEEKVVGFENGLRTTIFTFTTHASNEKILVHARIWALPLYFRKMPLYFSF